MESTTENSMQYVFDKWVRWVCPKCLGTEEIFVGDYMTPKELEEIIMEQHKNYLCDKLAEVNISFFWKIRT